MIIRQLNVLFKVNLFFTVYFKSLKIVNVLSYKQKVPHYKSAGQREGLRDKRAGLLLIFKLSYEQQN